MLWFLVVLMALQVVLFHVDEYYFHRHRIVNRSEIISALIDGVLYVIPLCIGIFTTYSEKFKILFIITSIISCISIAKNEFYYPSLRRKERLVHSFMYVLHPVILYSFFISWKENYFVSNVNFWIFQIIYLGIGLRSLAHQAIYWNYIYTVDVLPSINKGDS